MLKEAALRRAVMALSKPMVTASIVASASRISAVMSATPFCRTPLIRAPRSVS